MRAKAEKEAAEMQAAAIVELAEATRKKGLAEAEAQRALNDAINVLSDEQTSLKFKLALLQSLPAVIEKSVEPMKSIDGIKIIQVDGLNRGGAAGMRHQAALVAETWQNRHCLPHSLTAHRHH